MLCEISSRADYHLVYCVARHVLEVDRPPTGLHPGRLYDRVSEELDGLLDPVPAGTVAMALADAMLGPGGDPQGAAGGRPGMAAALDYRNVFISAGRAMSAARREGWRLDPCDATDVATVCVWVARDLRDRKASIGIDLAADAIQDAMRGRRPRW